MLLDKTPDPKSSIGNIEDMVVEAETTFQWYSQIIYNVVTVWQVHADVVIEINYIDYAQSRKSYNSTFGDV